GNKELEALVRGGREVLYAKGKNRLDAVVNSMPSWQMARVITGFTKSLVSPFWSVVNAPMIKAERAFRREMKAEMDEFSKVMERNIAGIEPEKSGMRIMLVAAMRRAPRYDPARHGTEEQYQEMVKEAA